MPVVPWKTRKKDGELILKLYNENRRLKQEVRSARLKAFAEIIDLMDGKEYRTPTHLKQTIRARVQQM